MSKLLHLVLAISLFSSSVCKAATGDAKTALLTEGDFGVKQLVTPGFDQLPLNRKLFAYYLSLAIDAGRDITWTQRTRFGLDLRAFLEKLWENSANFNPIKKRKLAEYLFKVFAMHGNYDKHKNQKVLPEGLSLADFQELAQQAETSLSRTGKFHRNLNQWFIELQRVILDPAYYPQYKPGPNQDLIADSATNFYGEGVKQAELDTLPPRSRNHFLSYPIKNAAGKITLQIQRLGGRFSAELKNIDFYLSLAQKYATDSEARILDAYRKAIRTGDPTDLLAADRLWAAHKPVDLDWVIGFVETYDDPLDLRGTWQGFIQLLSQSTSGNASERVRENVDYFESQMPVDPRFKKAPGFTPPWAAGAHLVYAGGASGERPFAGVNLPNDNLIRETVGSKSFTALNVVNPIGGKSSADTAKDDLFYSPRYVERFKRFDETLAYEIHVIFHEILGHGSGQLVGGVGIDALGKYGSAIEEARAETAALYHLLDPNLRKLKILNPEMSDADYAEFQELSIVMFFQNQLNSYFKLSETTQTITQAHQWAREVMLNVLYTRGALDIRVTADGIPHVEVVSLAACRDILGKLWAVVQECRSTGDIEKSAGLMDTFNIFGETHKTWRKAIVKARNSLKLPSELVFMNPRLELVLAADEDRATDVRLVYNQVGSIEDYVSSQVQLARRVRDQQSLCRKVLQPQKTVE